MRGLLAVIVVIAGCNLGAQEPAPESDARFLHFDRLVTAGTKPPFLSSSWIETLKAVCQHPLWQAVWLEDDRDVASLRLLCGDPHGVRTVLAFALPGLGLERISIWGNDHVVIEDQFDRLVAPVLADSAGTLRPEIDRWLLERERRGVALGSLYLPRYTRFRPMRTAGEALADFEEERKRFEKQ